MECGFVPQPQTPLHWPLLYRWAGRVIGAVPCAVLKHPALITQTIDFASAGNGEGSSTPSTSTLCTQQEHPFPPSTSRETRCGVPVRPQLLRSAVFSFLLHRRVIRTHDFVLQQHPVERECRSGNPEWGLEPVAEVLAHQDGATVGRVCRVVVSPVPRAFPRGQGSALAFGL